LYGVEDHKVAVLYGGVDPRFQPATSEATAAVRQKYGLGNGPFILSVGTVQPRKNYGRLIQAVAQIRAHHPDVHLVIAGGRGWLEDPIYDTLKSTSMENQTHFTGFVDDVDLPALYSAAACFAFPSLYEGFGLPVLEAMACGTPVITSNLSSLPEAAGSAGLLIDPYDVAALADALDQILTDTTLVHQLIRKGFQQIQKFTWQHSAQKLRQIYVDML
jgi:glycosyltransferase involved in cell wall biosynthesis